MKVPFLQLEHYSVGFGDQPIVHDLSFSLEKGKILGVIGESGSGKSLTVLSLFGLMPKVEVEGSAFLTDETNRIDLVNNVEGRRNLLGRSVGFIFQEPLSALNPLMRCGKQLFECFTLHQNVNKQELNSKSIALLQEVGITDPERILSSYPHELSGGQRQRLMIAMALANNPKLLIADEPTTALDPRIQHKILTLLAQLCKQRNMAMIMISHDLHVVGEFTDHILVMKQGVTQELGLSNNVLNQPQSDYTKALIDCKPTFEKRLYRLKTVEDSLDASYQPIPLKPLSIKSDPLISLDSLGKTFKSKSKVEHVALKSIDLRVNQGETVGIIGESGSGKSTLARMLVKLEEPTVGAFDIHLDEAFSHPKKIQFVFQDPYASLNPKMRVIDQIKEVLHIHHAGKRSTLEKDAIDLLESVGIPSHKAKDYPKSFSGGQRQRISIARALAVQPKIIVFDESVAALDVSIQSQIINLLNQIKTKHNLTYLFISHDIDVVLYFCNRIAVLKEGELVAFDQTESITKSKHPYVKELMALSGA